MDEEAAIVRPPLGVGMSPLTDEQAAALADSLTVSSDVTLASVLRIKPISETADLVQRADDLLSRLDEITAELTKASDSPARRRLMTAAVSDPYVLSFFGLDTTYAWVHDLVDTVIRNSGYVNIDTTSAPDGWLTSPKEETLTGLLLARVMRDLFMSYPNVRSISFIDDVTSCIGVERTAHSDADRYVLSAAELHQRFDVVRTDDLPGRDFEFVRGSAQVSVADAAVKSLRHRREGVVETTDDGDVTFYPSKKLLKRSTIKDPQRERELHEQGIPLVRHGVLSRQILEAMMLHNPVNRESVQLVVRPLALEREQDELYVLALALGMARRERYHNIYFDSGKLSATATTQVFCLLPHVKLSA